MIQSSRGFTLIELIMVIVLLGVLSAIALPRFADFGADAQSATESSILGAMRSAAAITLSACMANSGCDTNAASSSITLEGNAVSTVYGYPEASATGIQLAIDLSNSGNFVHAAGVSTLTLNTSNCTITYTQASGASSPPTYGGTC